ncbi:MAG: glycosyltransferase family 2 protein [Ignavibacterium sp.]|nr:glycosyltransferase family 2 protein [Ignavibacterium sp.]MCX7611306.1 glycosyltransferase family 2 protein [Ignavibacterium sp.]MDW8375658.1 glycosyltransferase family 2 protein [Ignavibacteriales bacterium]
MITVVCPVFNEREHIEDVLNFFISAKPDDKELIIIDGGSNDGTIELLEKWIKKYSNIKLFHNPNKYVPFALNLAIKNSIGDPIIRLDAHTKYSIDYFEKILETFKRTDADIVGGPMIKKGITDFQKAAAIATSSLFGIGDSKIHNKNYEGYSDHVYLGAWKRSLFDEIGYFDERLIRNQDDEFHYRARSLGKKIYLSPDIKSEYLPRKSFSQLFKQYFQYGLYKPLVLRKIKSEIKLRHLVPMIFTLYLISLPVLIFISWFLIFPLILYVLIGLIISFNADKNIKIKLLTFIIFPVIHLAYGSGFLIGLFKK